MEALGGLLLIWFLAWFFTSFIPAVFSILMDHDIYGIIVILDLVLIAIWFTLNIKETEAGYKRNYFYKDHVMTLYAFCFMAALISFIPLLQVIMLFIMSIGVLASIKL